MGETVFFRLLNADDKATALANEIDLLANPVAEKGVAAAERTFKVLPRIFREIPSSPFAYWASKSVRRLFHELPPFENQGRTTKVGMGTLNDFRFVRCWWEIGPGGLHQEWKPFVSGGKFSRFYSDVPLVVDWVSEGNELKTYVEAKVGSASRKIQAQEFYFRAGLTWPLRGISYSAQAVPAGCIFSVAGKMAFVPTEQLTAYLGLFNSSIFDLLIGLFAGKVGGVQYEAGLLQKLPVMVFSPEQADVLRRIASNGWSMSRSLDTVQERSHSFNLPALLSVEGNSLVERRAAWARQVREVENNLANLQEDLDNYCFALYGLKTEEWEKVKASAGRSVGSEEGRDTGDEQDDEDSDGQPVTLHLAERLISYAVGICMGRWDIRLAVNAQSKPDAHDPFALLPVCSPGMLQALDGHRLAHAPDDYPLRIAANSILVDDPGHSSDIGAAMGRVFDVLFARNAEARWQEAGEMLGISNGKTEDWLRKDFFVFHIKEYSRSRRKAPIYWQLATPSARYSVWLYLPRLTRDTLFTVLDLVKSKLLHEERQLETLRRDAGRAPSVSQRRELDAQESFVDELRTFREEVARVAPLWNPHLDDGVLINFAPLWRLVPQHRTWQKECKSCWEKLADAEGEYDWSHLAMHLWPERVVPKCREDRSLAIAHGLEDVFWEEDDDGKWKPRTEPTKPIDDLVQERTSAAVRTARDSLLSAGTPVTAPRRTSTPRTRKTRSP
ncbi:MAG TPA: hypothetical protein VE057_11790 [Archangium sp.]|nr:hypothetical protein [Archangium sp.]